MSPDQELLPSAEERMRALPEPPTSAVEAVRRGNRQMSFFLVISAIALAVAIVVAVFSIGSWNESEDRAKTNADAAASANALASAAGSQANAATKAAEEANRRLRALGKPTVPIPTVTISQPPIVIPEGLTEQQMLAVRGIIASELARAHPDLTPTQVQQISRVAASLVPKPADGKTPTAAQLQPLISAAQTAFCSDGRCNGRDGKPGAPGSPGAAGSPAPPVTDDQLRPLVASAFEAYCADGKCQGKVGPRGETGPAGADGRSVMDMDCVSDGLDSHWVITFDKPLDGQYTKTASGPCKVVVLPSADPSAARTR